MIVAAAALAASAVPVGAQTEAPRVRADVHAAAGWQLMDSRPPDGGGRRWHINFWGGGGAGWYWTEHQKTEIDVGAGSGAEAYRARQSFTNGLPVFESSTLEFSRRIVGISHQYQFLDNAWLHPHVAAGINLTWERRVERFAPAVVYDDPIRGARTLRPARTEGPTVKLIANPFVSAGLKAYVTPRTFFRTDVRLAFRGTLDDTLVRLGFGVDF
jgi:hypothetical protein